VGGGFVGPSCCLAYARTAAGGTPSVAIKIASKTACVPVFTVLKSVLPSRHLDVPNKMRLPPLEDGHTIAVKSANCNSENAARLPAQAA
jgi:hypothetical protein